MAAEQTLANPAHWPDDAEIGIEVTAHVWPYRKIGTFFEFFRSQAEFDEWKERKQKLAVSVKYAYVEWRWDWGPQLVSNQPQTV